MAEEPAHDQEIAASPKAMHIVAKAAGLEMKKALEQDPAFAQNTSNLVWSYIEPYRNVLRPVMDHFEDEVFARRHPEGGKLIWAKVFVTINDIVFDGSKHSNKPGDFWVLVLSGVEGDTTGQNLIGQSLNLKTRLEMKKGVILLGYQISESQ